MAGTGESSSSVTTQATTAQTTGSTTTSSSATTTTSSSDDPMVEVPSWEDFPSSYEGDDWETVLESLQAAIEAGFKDAGLVAEVTFVNGWEEGNETSQDPAAGTIVPKGTKVQVTMPVFD
jgi:hypothetical protein